MPALVSVVADRHPLFGRRHRNTAARPAAPWLPPGPDGDERLLQLLDEVTERFTPVPRSVAGAMGVYFLAQTPAFGNNQLSLVGHLWLDTSHREPAWVTAVHTSYHKRRRLLPDARQAVWEVEGPGDDLDAELSGLHAQLVAEAIAMQFTQPSANWAITREQIVALLA